MFSNPFIRLTVLLSLGLLAACNLTPQEAEQAVQTIESLPPSALAGLSATIEAMPPEQIAALETSAARAGVPTLSPNQVTAVVATVQAARATATAVGQAAASGERVNATTAPNIAPVIVYFFASAPNQAQANDGIRYFLNWSTENANRVEIFGNVMSNPAEGSWPVYNESNNWVLWAANDQVWVESSLQVQPDSDTGATLQNVNVSRRDITLTFRDPQFVDGDALDVDVNGVRTIDNFVTAGRHVSVPITLQPGANEISIGARSAGITPPLVTEVTVSSVTAGPATQVTRGLNTGERQSFTITAP
jgi:hypothetical protein